VLVRLLNISPPEVARIQAGAAKARLKQRGGVSLNMAGVGSSAVELLGSLKNLGAALPSSLQQQLQHLQGGAPAAGQQQQQQQQQQEGSS
jgi:hypothetical protein